MLLWTRQGIASLDLYRHLVDIGVEYMYAINLEKELKVDTTPSVISICIYVIWRVMVDS